MGQTGGFLLLLVVLVNFYILGSARLSSTIRALGVQGLALGLLPLAIQTHGSLHHTALALGTMAIKGALVPYLLAQAIRRVSVRREVEPRVGFVASMFLGAAALVLAFAVSRRLPESAGAGPLLVPVALATIMTGFIVLTTRHKALGQVVGYVVLEGGIYLFGLTQAERVPFLVELGVLLDVFVGIFVMGIVMFHISREFDTLDDSELTELRDP